MKYILMIIEIIFIFLKYGRSVYNQVKPIIKDLTIGFKETHRQVKQKIKNEKFKKIIKGDK